MSDVPKILIAAPQSNVKNYCFLDWLLNINRFMYDQDNIDIFLADNSEDDTNYKFLKSIGIKCKYIPKNGRGIIETLAECHQACVDYALENNYAIDSFDADFDFEVNERRREVDGFVADFVFLIKDVRELSTPLLFR